MGFKYSLEDLSNTDDDMDYNNSEEESTEEVSSTGSNLSTEEIDDELIYNKFLNVQFICSNLQSKIGTHPDPKSEALFQKWGIINYTYEPFYFIQDESERKFILDILRNKRCSPKTVESLEKRHFVEFLKEKFKHYYYNYYKLVGRKRNGKCKLRKDTYVRFVNIEKDFSSVEELAKSKEPKLVKITFSIFDKTPSKRGNQ